MTAGEEVAERVAPSGKKKGFSFAGIKFGGERDTFKAKHVGYLAYAPPSALRFSDAEEVNRRPPSPALPEFSYQPREYVPYLTEVAFEEGDEGYEETSEIVIDLPPHSVVSGVIDTTRLNQKEQVEQFMLDETRETILRPEEILIFFENDAGRSDPTIVVPFLPATPSIETIKSSATLKVE